MRGVDICASCTKELPDTSCHHFVNFRYEVPGSGKGEAVLVAVVCDMCAKDADNPLAFPALEAIINARIIRIENADSVFTPRGWYE